MALTNEQRSAVEGLAKWALEDDGVKAFRVQVEEYLSGYMPEGAMFVVDPSAAALGIPNADYTPLMMSLSTIRKIRNDHDIDVDTAKRIPELIFEHVLAMDSLTHRNSIVLVSVLDEGRDNEIVIAVQLDKEKRDWVINEIPSLYGKDELAFLIENTYAANLGFYPNGKTAGWLRRTGLPLPEGLTSRLLGDCSTVAEEEVAHLAVEPSQGATLGDFIDAINGYRSVTPSGAGKEYYCDGVILPGESIKITEYETLPGEEGDPTLREHKDFHLKVDVAEGHKLILNDPAYLDAPMVVHGDLVETGCRISQDGEYLGPVYDAALANIELAKSRFAEFCSHIGLRDERLYASRTAPNAVPGFTGPVYRVSYEFSDGSETWPSEGEFAEHYFNFHMDRQSAFDDFDENLSEKALAAMLGGDAIEITAIVEEAEYRNGFLDPDGYGWETIAERTVDLDTASRLDPRREAETETLSAERGKKAAEEAWRSLGDVACDDYGRILGDEVVENLGAYPAGTDREEIWHDIEERYGVAVHDLMFPDDPPADSKVPQNPFERARTLEEAVAAGEQARAALTETDRRQTAPRPAQNEQAAPKADEGALRESARARAEAAGPRTEGQRRRPKHNKDGE